MKIEYAIDAPCKACGINAIENVVFDVKTDGPNRAPFGQEIKCINCGQKYTFACTIIRGIERLS